MALNLAKRPFVDTRPANVLTASLVVLVLVLSVVSFKTFGAYIEGSRGTQAAIARLRGEISRYESQRAAGEAALARYDVEALGMAAEDANAIARRRAFSWTRFLTHLEEALPAEVRVVSIALQHADKEAAAPSGGAEPAAGRTDLELVLVSRDPLGLPKTIRAFYASPWFDAPVPHSDEGQERAGPEGRRMSLGVRYLDEGRPGFPAPAPKPAASRRSSAAGARR